MWDNQITDQEKVKLFVAKNLKLFYERQIIKCRHFSISLNRITALKHSPCGTGVFSDEMRGCAIVVTRKRNSLKTNNKALV